VTAGHKRRGPLEIVPDPSPAGSDDQADDYEWRSQAVVDEYSPEHQFVGSLMWLTGEQARIVCEMVPDAAIWRPRTRRAYELIRAVVAGGDDPTPVTVLSAGRHTPFSDALNPGRAPTANHHKRLALYLFDAYAQAIAPTAAIGSYARQVLDDAYRRAFEAAADQMRRLAAHAPARADLTDGFAQIRDELAELWRSCEAAKEL
jgi:hypothetical protein